MAHAPASGTPLSDNSDRIAHAAGLAGAATLTSRILGLVREQVLAALFGAGDTMDAFNVAFRIPNLVRDLFAEGAMSAAFVCGREGWACRAAWPSRKRGVFVPGAYLSVAPSVCRISCAGTTSIEPRALSPANRLVTAILPLRRAMARSSATSSAASWNTVTTTTSAPGAELVHCSVAGSHRVRRLHHGVSSAPEAFARSGRAPGYSSTVPRCGCG